MSQLLGRGLFRISARPAGWAGHGEHLLPRALTHLSPQAEAAAAKWDGGPHWSGWKNGKGESPGQGGELAALVGKVLELNTRLQFG